MQLSLVLLSLCLSRGMTQFPRKCTTQEALKNRSCCPLGPDGSICGVSSGRGRCQSINETQKHRSSFTEHNDDRLGWPHAYYDSVCVCNSPYSGCDCGECQFGYYGDQCKKKTIVRREIRELSHQDRMKVFSYLSMAKMKMSTRYNILITGNRRDRNTYRFVDASVYNTVAWIHNYAAKPLLINDSYWSNDFAHRGPNFLPWHRWFLLSLEREIQKLTDDWDFALPYYDWSREYSNCSICTDEFLGRSNSEGAISADCNFGAWKSICSGFPYDEKYCQVTEECAMEKLLRNPGADPMYNRLPTVEEVEATLKWEVYDTAPFNVDSQRSLRNILEGFMDPFTGEDSSIGMHNLVHQFMGGTMMQVPISSNDPLFFLHHCFIDKIYERWIQKYNGTSADYPRNNIPGQDANDNVVPAIPPVMNKVFLQSAETFGYTFSDYSPPSAEPDKKTFDTAQYQVKGR